MAGFYQSTLAPVKSSQQQTNLPWVEKYRPKTITDIAHQEDVVHALANCLQSNSLPHLLFYGPPGTGKTSTILAVARQMFGDELFRTRVLELNASDDRGIAVIRDKIKKFAQIAVTRQPGQTCPGFKIIILDEADLLTNDAQAALRRVIEKHTSVTRFCLICNYISKIIDPIASRCMKFRFKPISEQSHIERLQYICEQEQVGCTQDAIDLLVNLSEGDLRKSITTLQGSYRLFGDYLSADMIREFAALIPSEIVMGIFNTCWGSFDDMSTLVENLILDGYQPDSLISQFFDLIRLSDGLTDDKKARASEILAEVDYMLTTGANDKLALMKAFTGVQLIVHGQVINVLIY